MKSNFIMEEILIRFSDFVREIGATSGKIEKENILRRYLDDTNIKQILYFLYNPYIITGLSDKKMEKMDEISLNPDVKISCLADALVYLREHNTGKDQYIANLKPYIAANVKLKELLVQIFTKNLKIGVQPITLNKVFGKNFIPTFDVMLAYKYFDNPDKYVPEGVSFTLTEKLDGCRCVCVVEKEGVSFFTRQGKPIYGLDEVAQDVQLVATNIVLDGEILLDNRPELSSEERYRATVKEVNKNGDKHNLVLRAFDCIPIEEFFSGVSTQPYLKRRQDLELIGQKIQRCLTIKHLQVLPTLYSGTDRTQIQKYLNFITRRGGEGIMININNALYECKRSTGLLKVKNMQTMDLRVVDIEEGSGANKGKLGAIKVIYPAPDNNEYIVDVGSGFTLEQRELFFGNPELIVGKIVEIQYFEVSQNQNGGYALRFPVFLHLREDKEEPSIY